MTESKAKAPFISGPYYREIFREMRTIGIIFCIAQTIVGLLSNFGSPILSLFLVFTGTSTYRNVMLVYFFVAALNFLNAYIKRSAWDLRGSLPLKKRTIYASHLAAALTWAAFIFAANYVGMLFGELLRLIPGVDAVAVPAGYIGSGLSMLRELLIGLIVYGVMTMLASVVTRVFTIIIAGVVIVFVPILYFGFAQGMSVSHFSIFEHLLPIGAAARETVKTILLALAAAAAVVLGYVAFSNARAETYNKPARTRAIHIAIGVGLALFVGLLVMRLTAARSGVSLAGMRGMAEEDAGYLRGGLIVCVVLMLIAYIAYMWISLKSFKKACKNLVFLPIAVLIIGSALLFTVFADRQYERLDTSTKNVDYITIPNDSYESTIKDLASNMLFGGSSVSRGRNGSERVKLTDDRLLSAGSAVLTERKNGYGSGLVEDILESAFSGVSSCRVDVTLKNGGTWTVPISEYQLFDLFSPYINENTEFTSRYTDMKRFRGGSVLEGDGLDAEFAKTLMAEIESLAPADRMDLFTDSSSDYYSKYGYDYEFGSVSNELAQVTLLSPTYDHVAAIRLTELLPKSRELYMKKVSEHTRNSKRFDEFVENLEAADYDYVSGTLTLIEGGRITRSSFGLIPNDPDYEASYRSYAKRMSELLARLIKENKPVEGAEYVVGINVDMIRTLEDSVSFGAIRDDDATVYVGVSREVFEELCENFPSGPIYDEDFDTYDPDAEWL